MHVTSAAAALEIRCYESGWYQAAIGQGLAEAFASAFGQSNIDACRLAIEREIRHGHHYLVGLAGQRVAGFVSWRAWGEPRHQLAELYHLGQHQRSPIRGLGRQLVAAMETDAHAAYRQLGLPGVRLIFLFTHSTNINAQNTYRKCGYEFLQDDDHRVVNIPNFFREGVHERMMLKHFPEHIVSPSS